MGCSHSKDSPVICSPSNAEPTAIVINGAVSAHSAYLHHVPSSQDCPKISPKDNGALQISTCSTTGGAPSPAFPTKPCSSANASEQPPLDEPHHDLSGVHPGLFVQSTTPIADKYVFIKKLGAGSSGVLLLCSEKDTGIERAIKMIKKSKSSDSPNLLQEVNMLKHLDHPNIMKLFSWFEDEHHFYLVSEPYKGGELFEAILQHHRFSERDAAHIMQQLLSGVTYLHQHHTVHRDLKPENLLFVTPDPHSLIKIIDFGMACKVFPNMNLRERLGTAYYIAPEVLRRKYNEKCDIWSCGVTLYILLCGYPPFTGETDKDILRKISRGKFHFDPADWGTISDAAKDLIKKMLAFDPSKRISAEHCLQHPWIRRLSLSSLSCFLATPASVCRALANLRHFCAYEQLAQVTLLFIGSKLTMWEEVEEVTHVFRHLDTNGNGELDATELLKGYELVLQELRESDKEALIPEANASLWIEQEVERILNSADLDNNEFVTAALDRDYLLSEERLRAAFQMFDNDNSGSIASHELQRIITTATKDQWKEMLTKAGKTEDGEVDFTTFKRIILSLCHHSV